MGATACFSEMTEAGTIVTALFQQIDPGKTMVDRLVEHSVARTGMLLADMLGTARSGVIDANGIEGGIDPVVDAMRDGGLRRWLDVVAAHDDFTLRHCLLVAGLAAHLALHLGLSAKDRATLVRAGLVHDVGKASIPLAILNKPGPLDPDEMATMRTHPAAGHAILLASGMSDPTTLAATRHHHEMLDGSGYPDGLSGEQIGDAVRLLTICDIGAALIEQRPYRLPMPQADALVVLRKMALRGLDPALVEVFAASVAGVDVSPAIGFENAPLCDRAWQPTMNSGGSLRSLPEMRGRRASPAVVARPEVALVDLL
uniref:HD-GYP domain-containing protein n=1 Tax=Methylobacterium sp. TaxID=409 RepID=UPI0020C99D99|nr:HD domain-containing phosphohydrolase [Methylobacterium sp.]USU34636.1 HD domain-containing protein [Methylobacterium sp.]